MKASALKKQFKCLERNEQLTYDQLVEYIEGKVQTKKHMGTIDSSSPIDYSTDQNPNDAQRSYPDKRRQKNQPHGQQHHKQYWPQQYQSPQYFNSTPQSPPNPAQMSNGSPPAMQAANQPPMSNTQTNNQPHNQAQSQVQQAQPPQSSNQASHHMPNQGYNQGATTSGQTNDNQNPQNGNQRQYNNNHRAYKPWRNQAQADNQGQSGQNGIYQVSNKVEQTKKDLNIKGIAIFNNTVVDYFCDAGAVRSIISAELFEKIRQDSPGTKMEPYTDKPLRSVNSDLKILGCIRLDRCLMSADLQLKNAVLLVVQDLTGPSCILGRDWASKIPKLSRVFKEIERTVQEMSESIRTKIKEFPTIIKAIVNSSEICVHVNENKQDSRPGELLYSVQPKIPDAVESIIAVIESSDEIEDPKITDSRAQLEPILLRGSAKSMTELTPWKNLDQAFRIELIDPNHPPIACKIRP